MFTVRPVWHHFILWFLCAPLFLIEAYALRELTQVLALQDASRTQTAQADIVNQRLTANGPEVQYQFSVAHQETRFYATSMNALGRQTWVPISPEAWQQARANGKKLLVSYLQDNPWINQPVGRAINPIGDRLLTWMLFLMVDLLWVAESLWIARNYFHCQAAAERRMPYRGRFWRAVPAQLGQEYHSPPKSYLHPGQG